MIDQATREQAFQMAHGYCMHSKDCSECADQLHHMLPNTGTNRELFPLFIDSIFNLCPIHHDCHMVKPLRTISLQQARQYERWLECRIKRESYSHRN